jgi:hypothetical protein
MQPRDDERNPLPHRASQGAPVLLEIERLIEELGRHGAHLRGAWKGGEAGRLAELLGRVREPGRHDESKAIRTIGAELDAMLLAQEAETSAVCEKIEALIRICRDALEPAPGR